jgi:hypothetical protein
LKNVYRLLVALLVPAIVFAFFAVADAQYPQTLAGAVNGPPNANTFTPCDAGLVWASGGPGTDGGCIIGSALTQLTGQVTAGPGSGSQVATVVVPQANQLYVAVGGSDSNPCNLANPCATYAHAASLAVTAGATATNLYAVNFGPGHFSENVTFVSGVGVSGTGGFDTAVTVFTGSTFGIGSSFTGAALAGSFLSGVSFVPTGSFAFDLNFVGLSSTNSFFDIVNTSMVGTLTVEGSSGTTIAIYNSYNVSFNIQNAGTFSSWSNIMILPITTQCNSTVCGWTSQNDAITGSGSVLLEGSQTNTTVFANVGFRAGLTLNGTASTFAGDIGSIPTGGVTYSGGATSAQYSIGGLLPIVNIATGTGGIQFLTTDGGVNYWSAGPDGSAGITQLTGPVTAGPGAGSQATTINFGGGSLSGKLPIANLAACTSAQILESNATPTQTCTSVTGDVALSATGVTTVQALQGNAVASGALVKGDALFATSTSTWAEAAFSGDLTCSTSTPASCTVGALQGNAVASGALTKGDALFATSTSTWAEAAFGGDLTCSTVTPGSCTLGSIDGKSLPSPPGTGTTVLTDTTGTLSWASGSGTSVTGTGLWYSASGALNSAAVGCSGDTTCSAALSSGNLPITVTQIHGASVPIAGSLTIGNVLQVSGSSTTLAYAPVNLGGGANFVTGALPVANVAPGTSAQVLMSNGTPATTWTSFTGDTTVGATGVTATTKVNGILFSGTPAVGNQPVATSTTGASWSALNLAGGANYVTGNLPIANLAGNSSGLQYLTSNGGTNAYATITAASLPTIALTGQVTGSASGGSIATTIAPGTSGQILMSNATPATTWTTMSQDATISATGAVTNTSLQDGTINVGNNSGTLTWWTGATPELEQASTINATGADLLINPQVSTNTNGTSGGVTVTLGAPTGTGSEAQFKIGRAGTGNLIWEGPLPGNVGFGGISFVAPNSTGTNVAMFGSGGTTFLNSTVQIDMMVGALGPFEIVHSNGVQIAKSAIDFGGGVGVIGLGLTSTLPTTAPSTAGDTVLYSETSGLYVDIAPTTGSGFVTQQLAPSYTGTQNTQARVYATTGNFCRSTSTTNVTCLTIPVPSGVCAIAIVRTVGRVSTTIVSNAFLSTVLTCNNGGSATTTITNTTTISGSSGVGVLTATSSGANGLLQVNSGGSTTYDWSMSATIDYD